MTSWRERDSGHTPSPSHLTVVGRADCAGDEPMCELWLPPLELCTQRRDLAFLSLSLHNCGVVLRSAISPACTVGIYESVHLAQCLAHRKEATEVGRENPPWSRHCFGHLSHYVFIKNVPKGLAKV